MAKLNDVPKDQPVLIPTGVRPSLEQLAKTDQTDTVERVLGNAKGTKVLAFNSSI